MSLLRAQQGWRLPVVAVALAVAWVTGGCVDNRLDDELGADIALPVGVLVCAEFNTPEVFAYVLGPGGGVDGIAGTFNDAGGVNCFGIDQAPDGTVYLSSRNRDEPFSPDLVAFERDGTFLFNAEAAPALFEASGVAVAGDGSVVVGDLAGGLFRFSADGFFLGELVPGFEFESVLDVAATPDGGVVVADLARILRFRPSTTVAGAWELADTLGDDVGAIFPRAVSAFASGDVLVVDGGGTVFRFDVTGSFEGFFTDSPLGPGGDLLILPAGNVLVVDEPESGNALSPGGILELAPDGSVQRVLPRLPELAAEDITSMGLVRDAVAHAAANDPR